MTKHHALTAAAVAASVAALLVASFNGGTSATATSSSLLGAQKATGSISLVLVKDVNQDGLPNWGDTVRAAIQTTTTYPWVRLTCKQSGIVTAVGWAGYFEGALGTGNFGLYSPQWTNGPADCALDLLPDTNSKTKPLATTAFHAAG